MRLRGLLVALFIVYAVPATAVPILSIEPSAVTANAGQTFSVDVSITDVADLFAYQFDVGFDPGILAANAITEGALLGTGGGTFFIPGTIDNAAGTISFTANSLVGAVPGVTGSGLLAAIDFTALSAGVSPITLFGVTLLDSSFSGMQPTIQGGSVRVEGTTIPEPSTLLMLGTGLLALRRRRRSRVRLSAN